MLRQTRVDLKAQAPHAFVTEEQIELFGMEAIYYYLFSSATDKQGACIFILDALLLRIISGSHVRERYQFNVDRFYNL